jgi:hypothetical protein
MAVRRGLEGWSQGVVAGTVVASCTPAVVATSPSLADPPEGYIPVAGNVITTLFMNKVTREKVRYPRLGTFEVRLGISSVLLVLGTVMVLLLLGFLW